MGGMTVSAQRKLQGGSRLLDSLLYDEESVPVKPWFDDDYLPDVDAAAVARHSAEVGREPWYRWRWMTA